jgi:hypothetical protein
VSWARILWCLLCWLWGPVQALFSLLPVAFWLAVCGAILEVSFFPLGGWCCTSRVPHLCKLHQVAWATEQQNMLKDGPCEKLRSKI